MAANLARLGADAKKRKRFPDAVAKDRLNLFAEQLALATSSARNKVVLCGRRAGKSYTAVHLAIDAAQRHPGATIPVCQRVTTSMSAKAFWAELHLFDERHKLGIHFQDTYKIATLPNGAKIEMVGTENIKQCDGLRGGKFPRVIIDEAGTYRSFVLEYLVKEALAAALIDLSGDIIILGTPSILKAGYWFDITHQPGLWEYHHWTLLENTKLGKHNTLDKRQTELDLILARDYGGDADNPKYRREMLAEWTLGTGQLVYESFTHLRNGLTEMPAHNGKEWRYGLSWDFGYSDASAYVVTATRENDRQIYVVESGEDRGMTMQAIAYESKKLMARYRFKWIVGDAQAKQTIESLKAFGIPMRGSQKTDKKLNIEQVNVDLKAGRIQIVVPSNTDLIEDIMVLPWNDEQTDCVDGFDDHLPDAFLYNVREWGVLPVEYGEMHHVQGSAEWNAAEEERMYQQHLEHLKSQDRDSDDDEPLGLDEFVEVQLEGWDQ
jgi:hypothetical protein